MDNSNINNKDKYKRPGVIGGESSIEDSGENEKDRAGIDRPYKGDQSARGLDPKSAARETIENPGSCRVIISKDASQYLDEVAVKVNSGFEAGKVTRPQIVSWVLRRFAEVAGDDDIQELRAAHFDRIAYLEALLKRAKETGTLPAELSALIPPPCAPAHVAKKSKKPLTKNFINDENVSHEETQT